MDIQEIKSEYDKNINSYHELIDQVTDKISKRIQTRNIKIHSMKYRVKEFNSFYNKVKLKDYIQPFKNCTDLAGIRIICLFTHQIPIIVKLLNSSFNIIESFEKGKSSNKEFAYSSYHIILQPKTGNLKNLQCEIQIRTILQEAWAEIEHHINYKSIGADNELKRKINALAALFEVADDQFHQIHTDYIKLTQTPVAINKDINPILLYNFSKKTFPWAWKNAELFPDLDDLSKYQSLTKKLKEKRINTIRDLKEMYDKNKEDMQSDNEFHCKEVLSNPNQWPQLYKRVKATKNFYSPIVIIGMLINNL